MKSKILSFAFLILFAVFSGNANSVSACTCIAMSPCEAYYSSDLVFIGKAVSSKERKVKLMLDNKEIEAEVQDFDFEIYEVFGKEKEISSVILAGEPSSCGLSYEIGEIYLVYAHKTKDKGIFTSSACDNTKILSEAEEDLKYLREDLPKPEVVLCKPTASNKKYIEEKPFESYSPLTNYFFDINKRVCIR